MSILFPLRSPGVQSHNLTGGGNRPIHESGLFGQNASLTSHWLNSNFPLFNAKNSGDHRWPMERNNAQWKRLDGHYIYTSKMCFGGQNWVYKKSDLLDLDADIDRPSPQAIELCTCLDHASTIKHKKHGPLLHWQVEAGCFLEKLKEFFSLDKTHSFALDISD